MSSDITGMDRDAVSRKRIVSEVNKNFFVEAGAGAGKTAMLVNRMVAMVEQNKDISKICAITFTKAAAAEFYDRFQKALIERSKPVDEWKDRGRLGELPKPTEETRMLCEKALRNIDLCFMGTIDAFCKMVLSEHPSEAGIPSDAVILTNTEEKEIYRQMFVKICEGAYGPEMAAYANSFRDLVHKPDEAFAHGMGVMMGHRNVTYHYNRIAPTDFGGAFSSYQEGLTKALQCILDHKSEVMYESEQKNLDAWDKLEDALHTLKNPWGTNPDGVIWALSSVEKIRLKPDALTKYAVSLQDWFVQEGKKGGGWLSLNAGKDGGILAKMKALKYDIAMSFLGKCVPIMEKYLKEKGCLTFFDYLYYLRNMLKKDAAGEGKLIQYIYDRHSYFLVDEFQDTNPVQSEIIFYLTAEKPQEQWRRCVPRPGSLFIVGDPKQSIYRFRNADVTAFLNVKNLFRDSVGEVLFLSRNFRSEKELCRYFNRVFTKMLPEEKENQSKYEEIPLSDVDRDGFQGTYTYEVTGGKGLEEYPDLADPLQIGKIITTLVHNPLYEIWDEEGKKRQIEPEDIMVITSAKKQLVPIMQHLDELGVKTRVEGKVSFGDNEALRIITQVYGAMADGRDQAALYGALTGKLYGLTGEELYDFRCEKGRISLFSQSDEFLENLESKSESTRKVYRIISSLGKKYMELSGLSPAAVFAHILESSEIYRVADADNLEVLYYTLELMRSKEKSGEIASLCEGKKYLDSLLTGETVEERCLNLSGKKRGVHMANLHKVKGLEEPVVILAASANSAPKVNSRVVHKETGAEGYIIKMAPIGDTKTIYFETETLTDETAAETEALEAEKLRLIYVAATRARNVLIVSNRFQLMPSRKKDAAPGEKVKTYNTRWKPLIEDQTKDIFAFFEEQKKEAGKDASSETAQPETLNAAELYEKAAAESVLKERRAENATYNLMNPSHAKKPSKLADDAVSENDRDSREEAVEDRKNGEKKEGRKNLLHRYPDILGTMVHRIMEKMVSSGNAFSSEYLAVSAFSEFCIPEMESAEKEFVEALKTVADTMRKDGYEQKNNAPRNLLEELRKAEECWCEVPFCYQDETTVWNGIMDLIYKMNGRWYIVDYKTGVEESGLDRKYANQLDAYINALHQETGEPVVSALTYHIPV